MKPGSVVMCVKGTNHNHELLKQYSYLFHDWLWAIEGRTYTVADGTPCCEMRVNIVELPDGTIPQGFGPRICQHCGTSHQVNGGWPRSKFVQISSDDELAITQEDKIYMINQQLTTFKQRTSTKPSMS